jgi:hypothetical protein
LSWFQGISQSGAFYVLDRRSNTWLWLDFEDDHYGGYSTSDFDLLVDEYDFLSLVERPGLLNGDAGWLLEGRRPAEMASSLHLQRLGARPGAFLVRFLSHPFSPPRT